MRTRGRSMGCFSTLVKLYLYHCPALTAVRYCFLGNFLFDCLAELASVDVINLLNFIKHTKCFEHLEE